MAYYTPGMGTCMCAASSQGTACSVLQRVNLISRQRLHQLVAPLEGIYNQNVVNPEPLPALLRKWPRNNEMTSISEASGRSTGAVAYSRAVVSQRLAKHSQQWQVWFFPPHLPRVQKVAPWHPGLHNRNHLNITWRHCTQWQYICYSIRLQTKENK